MQSCKKTTITVTWYRISADYRRKIALRKIDNVSEQVIEKTDYNLRKKLESIDTNHFKIDIPSALSMIIRSCLKSKQTIDKFLDSTIELRNSKKIENFRKWLAELELAFNTDIKKYKRMKKKASNLLEKKSENYLMRQEIPQLSR